MISGTTLPISTIYRERIGSETQHLLVPHRLVHDAPLGLLDGVQHEGLAVVVSVRAHAEADLLRKGVSIEQRVEAQNLVRRRLGQVAPRGESAHTVAGPARSEKRRHGNEVQVPGITLLQQMRAIIVKELHRRWEFNTRHVLDGVWGERFLYQIIVSVIGDLAVKTQIGLGQAVSCSQQQAGTHT
jgi:hypothetical protein